MAKIERYNGNLKGFASNARAGNRTVFSDSTISDTLNDNITSDYLEGWSGVNIKPPMEWFNGAMYTISQTTAYLYQMGIPEYNSNQEYNMGSIINSNGVLYKSLIDNNISNDITDTSSWALVNPVISDYNSKTNIYGTDKLAVENTSGDINYVTVDLLGSGISNQIFATDSSTDATKIDLKQANTTVISYKDGLIIKFKAKKNSVNNMQIRLNGLDYKNISSDIGIGSWMIGDTVSIIYDAFLGVFKPNDERNKTKNGLTIDDFNNYIYPSYLWVNASNASNAPEKNYGFLEVKKVGYTEGDPNADCVQIFYVVGNVDNIYYRRKGYETSTWSAWIKLSNNYDISSLQNTLQSKINTNSSDITNLQNALSQIHALAIAGTQSGNFKFMLEGDP